MSKESLVKKGVVLISVVFILISVLTFTQTTPNITVVRPNGGEVWQAGTTEDITWTYFNAGSEVRIELLKGGVWYQTLDDLWPISETPYKWYIPPTIPAGSDYKIKVTSIDVPGISDTSDNNFTIIAAPATPTPTITPTPTPTITPTPIPTVTPTPTPSPTFTPTPSPTLTPAPTLTPTPVPTETPIIRSIEVISPNGGENWEQGSTQQIEWKSYNTGALVTIDLLKTDEFYQTIVNSYPNDGIYEWTIPNDIPADNDYKVRITADEFPEVYDASDDYFTISSPEMTPTPMPTETATPAPTETPTPLPTETPTPAPTETPTPVPTETPIIRSIEVISPNGGENWPRGTAQNIVWSSVNAGSFIAIDLLKEETSYRNIVDSYPINDVPYVWTIPNDIPVGNDYKIKVTSKEFPEVFDTSDDNFTISVPVPTPTTTPTETPTPIPTETPTPLPTETPTPIPTETPPPVPTETPTPMPTETPTPVPTETSTPVPTTTPTPAPTQVILKVEKTFGLAGDIDTPVKISLENGIKVRGIQFTLCDIPDLLDKGKSPIPHSIRTPGFSVVAEEYDGCLRVLIISLEGKVIMPGSGPIAVLYYDVQPGAPENALINMEITECIAVDENYNLIPVDLVNGTFILGKGDLNGDGEIDIFDIVRLIHIVLGKPPAPTPYELQTGDINDDGEINIIDILMLVDIVLNRT